MSRLLDALDAALDAFQTAGATADGADPPGSDPRESAAVPLEPPVAPAVAPLEPAENHGFSTGATGATANHKIKDPEAHASDKADVLLHREPGVARSLSSQVAPVALVDKPQKSACFTGAIAGATGGSSGTMADSCGFLPPAGACETFSETISEVLKPPEPLPGHSEAAEPVDNLPADLQTVFDERAAIADVDGGLGREAAERLARQEVTSGPVRDDVTSWKSWMQSRIAVWQARGWSGAEVLQIVWSEAECAWSLRHHPAANPNRCAGCGRWMLDAPGMSLLDGAVVHVGGPVQLDCLIVYGEQWRQAASAALVALLKEQAAIAEVEGGLDHEVAEWLAWAEVTGKI
jgi:hypothetical protein